MSKLTKEEVLRELKREYDRCNTIITIVANGVVMESDHNHQLVSQSRDFLICSSRRNACSFSITVLSDDSATVELLATVAIGETNVFLNDNPPDIEMAKAWSSVLQLCYFGDMLKGKG